MLSLCRAVLTGCGVTNHLLYCISWRTVYGELWTASTGNNDCPLKHRWDGGIDSCLWAPAMDNSHLLLSAIRIFVFHAWCSKGLPICLFRTLHSLIENKSDRVCLCLVYNCVDMPCLSAALYYLAQFSNIRVSFSECTKFAWTMDGLPMGCR